MKPSVLANRFLTTRYLGLYKMSLYKLYQDYVIPHPLILDTPSLIRCLSDILKDRLWGTSGTALLSPEHFDLILLDLPDGLSEEDRRIVETTRDVLRYREYFYDITGPSARRPPMQRNRGFVSKLAHIEVKALESGSPVYHSHVELPEYRQQLSETWGSLPGTGEFVEFLFEKFPEGSDIPVDVLSAFDGEFSIGPEFEETVVKKFAEHGGKTFGEVLGTPSGVSDLVLNGRVEFDPTLPRDIVSFPEGFAHVLDTSGTPVYDSDTLPSGIGMAGIFYHDSSVAPSFAYIPPGLKASVVDFECLGSLPEWVPPIPECSVVDVVEGTEPDTSNILVYHVDPLIPISEFF